MMDDSSLARALADDLDGHFEQLVRTYQDRLYGFALRLTDSRQDAEESTQDAFVRAYRALERYPAERRRELRLRPWLYQIALWSSAIASVGVSRRCSRSMARSAPAWRAMP